MITNKNIKENTIAKIINTLIRISKGINHGSTIVVDMFMTNLTEDVKEHEVSFNKMNKCI